MVNLGKDAEKIMGEEVMNSMKEDVKIKSHQLSVQMTQLTK